MSQDSRSTCCVLGRGGRIVASFTIGVAVAWAVGFTTSAFAAPPVLVGDYNNDGTVNAADYTVWRHKLGSIGASLENRDSNNGSGPVSAADYDSWKSRFGETAPGSGSASIVVTTGVPEPASWLLAAAAMLFAGLFRRRR